MSLRVEGLSVRVGSFSLSEISLSLAPAQYGVVIGPAGSGKTTLLESIAGVTPIRGGRIEASGLDVTSLPPERRGIALVYQHAYLFPHLSAGENVAYGGVDRAVVAELGERLGTATLASRDVASLSGGERQLVALARALARRPGVLLLDEPFAALDPRTRIATRRTLRSLHDEWGFTVLHVTHDFAEAGALGDVATLLDRGRVLQSGPPEALFRAPASPAIADFLGAENVLAGVVENGGLSAPESERQVRFRVDGVTIHAVSDFPSGPAHAVIRAEEIVVAIDAAPSSMRNQLEGTVLEVARAGPLARITIDVGGLLLVAAVTSHSLSELELTAGRKVVAAFKATAVHIC